MEFDITPKDEPGIKTRRGWLQDGLLVRIFGLQRRRAGKVCDSLPSGIPHKTWPLKQKHDRTCKFQLQ